MNLFSVIGFSMGIERRFDRARQELKGLSVRRCNGRRIESSSPCVADCERPKLWPSAGEHLFAERGVREIELRRQMFKKGGIVFLDLANGADASP